MDARGGCCIARYAGGSGGGGGGGGRMYDHMSKVDRIMLQYRPIAPKPVAAGSGSGGSTAENSGNFGRIGRGKRKYVRANGNKNKKDNTNIKGCSSSTVAKKRKVQSSSPPNELVSGGGETAVTLSLLPETPDCKEVSPATGSPSYCNNIRSSCESVTESVTGGGDAVVTLPLLPETPDRKESSPAFGLPVENSDLLLSLPTTKSNNICNGRNKSAPILLRFNNHQRTACDGHVDHAVAMIHPVLRRSQAVSFVTVECVTDTWMSGEVLGCTDEERMVNLENDTCPAFVSDGPDRVVWTNTAYRKMAGGQTVVVVVGRKDKWVTVPVTTAAFTCKVRVTWGANGTTSPSRLTVPCDVWRMENGGYAWRLDVKAALCLGR